MHSFNVSNFNRYKPVSITAFSKLCIVPAFFILRIENQYSNDHQPKNISILPLLEQFLQKSNEPTSFWTIPHWQLLIP